MSEWRTPEFDEIRMDAEINCYSSALHDLGAIGRTDGSEPAAPSVRRADGRASS